MSCVYAIVGYTTDYPTMQSLSMMGWFGLVQLIYCIMSWMKRGNQFISPYIIFLLTLYIFSYGQSFLWALGLESERTLVGFRGCTIPEIFEAQVLTLIMLAFFQVGASYYSTNRQTFYNDEISVDDTYSLRRIGWFLFIVSVIPYSMETVQKMIISMTSGYAAIYQGEDKVGLSNWSGIIADYCIPSLICLYISYRKHKTMRRSITLFFVVNIVVILVTGGRTFAVILIALIVILYNYLVKRLTKKWLLVGCIGAFVLLQVLSYVANVRVESGRSASLVPFPLHHIQYLSTLKQLPNHALFQLSFLLVVALLLALQRLLRFTQALVGLPECVHIRNRVFLFLTPPHFLHSHSVTEICSFLTGVGVI